MKRIIIAIGLAILAAPATFAQGTFLFSGDSKTVWDDYSGAYPKVTGTTIDVAFLIGTDTPLISQIATSIPTNNAANTYPGNPGYYQTDVAWDKILNDPNYHLATNGGTTVVASVNPTNGSWTYNGYQSFTIPNTVAGGTYTVYAIGWNSSFATPQAAAAWEEPVGWSAPFTYVTGDPNALPPTAPQQFGLYVTPFGIGPIISPEPGTLALTGMGLASLLAFRRRHKSK